MSESNIIYNGDCKDVLRRFPAECIDLIYLDPPFFTNKKYEVIWGDGYEIRAFEDRWKNGKKGIDHYINWMEERLRECHRVLKSTGSIYLHCDDHANAHLRLLMDDKSLFGENNFRNEIIWQRTHAHGSGTRGFSRVHDTILFYSKTKKFTLNRQHVPYSEKYVKTFFRYKDERGRYRLVIATGSGVTKSDYLWKGKQPTKGRHWAYKKEKMMELEKEGKIVYSRTGKPNIKQYLDEKKGTLVTDIWMDIKVLPSQSKERLGYPTQKPEKLLERIIKASSNSMDVVLDPFCGCGTTIAVAQRLGRRWIGIDVSPTACKLMATRLRKLHVSANIIGLPMSLKDLKGLEHFEFQNWVVRKLSGRVSARKTSDMGIDGYTFEGFPIQVKQSEKVGRNVVDNFETAIRRAKKKRGVIVAFSFGSGANNEVARAKRWDDLEIELVTVKKMLNKNYKLAK